MPFQSKSQMKYLFAKKPEIAKEFASKTHDMKDLPKHKKQLAALKRMKK